jgi:hypothetical protein
MKGEPSNEKQLRDGADETASTGENETDFIFIVPIPEVDNTTSHSVDAYALRIGGLLVTYFPEADQFSWYKHPKKIKTNPAWIPLDGPVPKLLPRPNNTYLIRLFPRSTEWLVGVFAQFGEKNTLDALATALLLEIEEELGRKEAISNGD